MQAGLMRISAFLPVGVSVFKKKKLDLGRGCRSQGGAFLPEKRSTVLVGTLAWYANRTKLRHGLGGLLTNPIHSFTGTQTQSNQ